ncbi:uncharacterized protein LOC111716263 [Eurytemora carolleeae]|uniref:uncharacterized protein LOC111716263 n=1 Tax=Eurytemora carolleeae TaxID=1294199 RepID=UPI000C7667AC|nr:uncharacterized protein LOC111716263 [Eurytemora carolleeae]|eukprot:XP_023347468.1 uncharacterized protein LOC111716263 [Eurytemora affinis]
MEDDIFCVFSNLSFINHSCSPSAAWGCIGGSNKNMEVRAIIDIQPQTEITVNYIENQSFLLSTTQRKTLLSQVWEFTCTCNGCLADEKKEKGVLQISNQILERSRAALCKKDYELLWKLQKQKLRIVKTRTNLQQLSNTYQTLLVVSAALHLEKTEVEQLISEWKVECCDLEEYSKMFDDLTKSFDKGKPKEEKEFMDSGNLRNEWISLIYRKL